MSHRVQLARPMAAIDLFRGRRGSRFLAEWRNMGAVAVTGFVDPELNVHGKYHSDDSSSRRSRFATRRRWFSRGVALPDTERQSALSAAQPPGDHGARIDVSPWEERRSRLPPARRGASVLRHLSDGIDTGLSNEPPIFLVRAKGRIERSTVLESISTRPWSRKRKRKRLRPCQRESA